MVLSVKNIIGRYLVWLAPLLVLLLLVRCTPEEVPDRNYSRFLDLEQQGQQEGRLVHLAEPISLRVLKGSKEASGDDLVFTLEYLLEGPTVDGHLVQASHIAWHNGHLYLSYNTAGDPVRGGFEVIDFSNPADPKLRPFGTDDKEYSSIDIYDDPLSGRTRMMLAGTSIPDQIGRSAILQVFEIDQQGLPDLNPVTSLLQGYVATDISRLGVVTGTSGGFYSIDPSRMDNVTYGGSLDDARSVAWDPLTNQYVVLLGQPGRLVTGIPSSPRTINLGGINLSGTKNIVRVGQGYAFAALGDGGLGVVDLAKGEEVFRMPAPEPAVGGNPDDYVTNGVSVNAAGYVFIANGAAGVYVARTLSHGSLELLGFLDLGSSVNYVESKENYLFVASGTKGVAILKIDGLPASVPSVNTSSVPASGIGLHSAVVAGIVLSDGGLPVTERGFCWSTQPSPDMSDSSVKAGAGTGSFSTTIGGLLPGTTYRVRAYAISGAGTVYGNEVSFLTLAEHEDDLSGTFVDSRDGKRYKTIVIGGKEWMAENLAWLPSVSPPASGSQIDPFYYVYGYNGFQVSEAKSRSEYQRYGVLYNHLAARSACPDGWHLPTDEEWMRLEQTLGMTHEELERERFRMSGEIGTRLKSTTGWSDDGNGDNSSSFDARPSGYRAKGGPFKYEGVFAAYWTADAVNDRPVYRSLYYFNDGVYRSTWTKSAGFSVRCIRN